MKQGKRKLPPIGQRIMRSVVGVALCFAVYYLRGKRGIPFYSALAVLQCIQPYMESSREMAKKRTLGTLIGAFWGFLVLLMELYLLPEYIRTSIVGSLLIACMTGVVLYTTVLFDKKNVSYFSCVVFLSITIMHMTDENPYIFVLNRVLDTIIGVIMAVVVNSFHLPRKRNRDILFVSGIDEALLNKDNCLAPYSKVELNKLISDGAQFTVSTMRTPASILETLSGIKFKIPVITMDGAALYDISENTYLKTYVLPYRDTKQIMEFIDRYQMSYFANAIIDDVLIIYYEELQNAAEKDIFRKLRKSPYRNYIKRKLPEGEDVTYLMMIHESEKIGHLYEGLVQNGYGEKYRIIMYPSKDYPGYSYIKIYNKEATRANMLKELKQMLKVEKSITFGSIQGESDVWIENSDENKVVKELKRLYAPVVFRKKS